MSDTTNPTTATRARVRALLCLESEQLIGATGVVRGPSPVVADQPRGGETARFTGSGLDAGRPAVSTPSLPTEEKARLLRLMDEAEVRGCTKCKLCRSRERTVFGEVNPDARLMFIGEAPGETEDLTGRPFVGKAGELLDKMISAMNLTRELVYIANVVKCRPPANRTPTPDEVAACTPYLERQIDIVSPRVIVTLGLPATQFMLGTNKLTMSRTRGTWHEWRGIKVMPTYHPAYLLRSYTDENRRAVWSDLRQVMRVLTTPPDGQPST